MCVSRAILARQAARPGAREAIARLASPPERTVLKSPPSTTPATRSAGEARRFEHDRGWRAPVRPRGFLNTHSVFGELKGSRCASITSRLAGRRPSDLDCGAERHPALARQRQFDRQRIEQRLGGDDRVAAVLTQLGAVAHRRHVEHRQSRARRRDRRCRALPDRAGGSRTPSDRRHRTRALRRHGDTAPGPAARNAPPAGRR